MLENLQIPANFKEVSGDELNRVLSLSGSRQAMYFFPNDTIVCSEKVYSQNREVTRDGVKTTIPVYYLGCEINGTAKLVPFASFRRFPKEPDDILQKSTLMRSLFDGSDAERLAILKGKTLKVSDVVEGEAIDWTKSNADTREFVYKKAKFPVLTIA